MDNKTLTALRGVQVGHSTHLDKLTGCTVVLFDDYYPVFVFDWNPNNLSENIKKEAKPDFDTLLNNITND
jgi:hypothetical protein